ncbi:hypothetical protein [Acidianus sp.]|uniref:hypothetical protein n=1 Tax=Acidianus sp. TaxID=1872104 RepID=UPI00397A334A
MATILFGIYTYKYNILGITTIPLLIISAIFYLIAPIFSLYSKGINISKITILLELFAFLLLAITYIITAREIGFNASFYGVRFYSSTTPGVMMLIGIILIMLTMLMDLGQLLNSVIQILGIILIIHLHLILITTSNRPFGE